MGGDMLASEIEAAKWATYHNKPSYFFFYYVGRQRHSSVTHANMDRIGFASTISMSGQALMREDRAPTSRFGIKGTHIK